MKRLLFVAPLAVSGAAFAQTYSNPANFQIPAVGTGGTSSSNANSTVTSTISVAGAGNNLISMTVSFSGLTGTFPDDLDFMLVSPGGLRTILMSDAGGSSDISGVNLTFSDAAATNLPDAAVISSGTFKPTNFGTGDVWYNPDGTLQTAATTASLATFAGSNPNGTWTLWARDDAGGDVHNLSGGWAIHLNAVPEPATFAVLGLGAAALLRRRRK